MVFCLFIFLLIFANSADLDGWRKLIKRIERRKILEKRSDDDADTILKRYETYMEITKPVLDYYSKNQSFHEIDGSKEITDISQKIEEIVNEWDIDIESSSYIKG